MATPADDRTDFEDAERGFVGAMTPCVVTAGDGRVDPATGTADLSLNLTKAQLLGLLGGGGLDGLDTTGDPGVLQMLLGVLDPARADFAIVTP